MNVKTIPGSLRSHLTPDRIAAGALFIFGSISWLVNSAAFIWDDSYFYLVIARNIVATGAQTFSNLYATNGFHPLWLYLLTGYGHAVHAANADILFQAAWAVPLSCAILLLGMYWFGKSAVILKLPAAPLVLIPVAYIFFFPVLYSEAVVYYACLALATLLFAKRVIEKNNGPYIFGAACALLFFSRLDSIFIILFFMLCCWRANRNTAAAAKSVGLFLLLVFPYLCINSFVFGGLMPVSGWIKSSFPLIILSPKTLHYNSLFGYNVFAGVLPILFASIILYINKKIAPLSASLSVYTFAARRRISYIPFYSRGFIRCFGGTIFQILSHARWLAAPYHLDEGPPASSPGQSLFRASQPFAC